MKNLFNTVALATIVSATSLLVGCNSGTTSAATKTQANNLAVAPMIKPVDSKPLKLGNDFYVMLPGAGYDSSTNTVVSDQSCLSAAQIPSNITIVDPSAYLHMGDQVDLSTLENQFGISVGGGAGMGGGMFSASALASYLQEAQQSSYKINFTYLYEYAGTAIVNNIGQGQSALTPTAAGYAFGGDPLSFRKMCGDQFVSQMNVGAALAVTLSVKFHSAIDKQKFNAALNANIGIASVAASVETLAKTSQTSVDMSISAVQLGGQPQKLNNIFGTAGKNGYSYIECSSVESSSANKAACLNTMSNIVTYGQSFGQQLSESGAIDPERLYYYNPTLSTYNSIGVTANLPSPSDAVLEASANILRTYKDTLNTYQFITNYLNEFGESLTVSVLTALQDAQIRYQARIQNVYQDPAYSILDCYRGYISSQCPQIEANLESALANSQYQPPHWEKNLIDYLESNEYYGELYTYTGTGGDAFDDYKIILNGSGQNVISNYCTFFPISTPQSSLFSMICNNNYFNIASQNGLVIEQIPAPSGNGLALSVNGLQYNAINPNYPAFQPLISYPDMIMTQGAYDPNTFFQENLNITGGSSFTESGGSLSLNKLSKTKVLNFN